MDDTKIELAFRRGYTHGYDKGIDDFLHLLQSGVPMEQAYNRLVEFFNDGIQTWRGHRPLNDPTPPPEFSEWNL